MADKSKKSGNNLSDDEEKALSPTESEEYALVPGAKNTPSELAIRRAQQVRHAVKTLTHSEANEVINRWIKEFRKAKEEGEAENLQEEQSSHALVGAKPHALIGVSLTNLSFTPLEDQRRKHGLHEERKLLYEELGELISLEEGLGQLDAWTKEYLHQPCSSMEQAQVLFPELTATEIAMLPLLAYIPETIQLFATGFDSVAAARTKNSSFRKHEHIDPDEYAAVPMQLSFRTDGIEYGTEESVLHEIKSKNVDDAESSEANPGDREITPYTAETEGRIQKIVMLSMELPRLLEVVQSKTSDALVVGVGLVQKEALQRVRQARNADKAVHTKDDTTSRELATIPEDVPEALQTIERLQEVLQDLDPQQTARFREEEQTVANCLMNAVVENEKGKQMTLQELVYLIGLLDEVPRCLLALQPFNGKIRFYGSHMLFADESDHIIEACPLSQECLRCVQQAIFDESKYSSERNATMHAIQAELTIIAQTKIFGPCFRGEETFEETTERLSSIEARAMCVHQEHGITIAVLGAQTILEEQKEGRFISDAARTDYEMKIGSSELGHIACVVDALGASMPTNVTKICKKQYGIDARSTNLGCIGCVTYDPDSETITIYDVKDVPYSHLKPEAQTERALLTAYGCGLAAWHTLDDSAKRRWSMFFRAIEQTNVAEQLANAETDADLVVVAGNVLQEQEDEYDLPEGPHASNCVTEANVTSPRDDFATHFAYFVLSNTEFAEAAVSNRVLRDKYVSLEAIIGPGANFTDVSQPVATFEGSMFKQFPQMPNIKTMDEFIAWLKQEQDKEEQARNAQIVDAATNEVTTETEEDIEKERQQFLRDVQNAVSGTFDNFAEHDAFDDFCNAILELWYSSEFEDLYEGLEDLVTEYAEVLEDSSDTPLEDLTAALEEMGYFDA